MLLRRTLVPLAALFFLLSPWFSSLASAQPAGVLIIAHGASASWNAPVEAAAARVRQTMPAEVGFLMGDGATPQQAYDKLVHAGVSRIVVVPLLISSHSAHAEQIKFIAGLRPDYPHAEHMMLTAVKRSASVISVTAAMDDDAIVAAILADRAKALSRDAARETLVLVAHGPNEDDEAAQWTAAMSHLVAHMTKSMPFASTDVRLLRDDAPAPVKDRALAELRASVASHAKSGRVVVVPLLLAPGQVADEIPKTLAGLDFAWDGKTLLPDDRVADWIVSRAQGAIAASGSAAKASRADGVNGVVCDTSGAALPGATIVLRSKATGLQRADRTDGAGAFAFRGVTPGEYEITASLSGFTPVVIAATSPASGALSLTLTAARFEESVTVVSDGRADRLRGTATMPVVVVDGQAMRDAAIPTVGEALRDVPGVISRRGSEGAETGGEQVQGVDSRQVLVLIDGQPIVGARGVKSGVIDLDQQSTNSLDRVEVVKGSASALYGSDAMGGVVNLIPRDARRPLEFSATAAGGDFGGRELSGDVGAQHRGVGLFVSGGGRQRDSFDLTPTTADTTGASFTRENLLARVTATATPAWLLAGTVTSYWNAQDGRSAGELGLEQDHTTNQSQTYGFRANWNADARTSVELRAYRGRYAETSTGVLFGTATPVEPGDLFEGLTKLDASISRLIGDRQVIRGGVEWSEDEYRGRNRIRDAAGDSATTSVGWAQYELNPAASTTITAGLRYDDQSVFGGATSPKVAIVQRLGATLTARASYGRGFRTPDLGQLYYRFLNPTNLYQVIGNTSLQPERSDSFQAGIDAGSPRVHVGVNVFHTRVTNLIQAVNLGFIATRRSCRRSWRPTASMRPSTCSSIACSSSTRTSRERARKGSSSPARSARGRRFV